MDLRQLEVFARVVECRSFSRAAEALGLTQSTVSEHVRLLEEDIGTRLLDRLGRETLPTRPGELLHGYATRLLALRAEARQALDQLLGRVAGTLSLGASTIPGEYILPEIMGRFRAKFPQVAVDLHIADSRAIVDAVASGRVDVGVVGAPPDRRGLESAPLWPDELVLVVPPDHPWAGRAEVSLAELAQEPLVVREEGSGSRETLERALEDTGLRLAGLRVVARIGSSTAAKQAVKAGVGVTIISRRAVEEDCQRGLLWAVAVRDLAVTRHFHLVTHAGRSRSPLAQAFLDFLASG